MLRAIPAAACAVIVGGVGALAVPQADTAISSGSIGGVRVCQPLDSVNVLYPAARDTMLFSTQGGMRWPGKIVALPAGGHLFVEASYLDRSSVWRISTTSPVFAAANGLRVGSSVADVLRAGERMTFTFPQGYILAHLTKARFAFEVDDSSTARFHRRWGGRGSPLLALDRSARIKRIIVSGGCRPGRP